MPFGAHGHAARRFRAAVCGDRERERVLEGWSFEVAVYFWLDGDEELAHLRVTDRCEGDLTSGQ